jgi:hypothetical protein
MARLSAHGTIVGTIQYTCKVKRYMSDGKVLVNHGSGWKISGKLKIGITPQDAFARAVQKQNEFYAARPAAAEYRRQLHDLACVSKRVKLHTCVALMPDDCDGVWSEACDGYGDNVSASVDEVADLCRAYVAAMRERRKAGARKWPKL